MRAPPKKKYIYIEDTSKIPVLNITDDGLLCVTFSIAVLAPFTEPCGHLDLVYPVENCHLHYQDSQCHVLFFNKNKNWF